MKAVDILRDSVCHDDIARWRDTLASHPELRDEINEPIGHFDSPLIISARSPAMLDALLEAGADINARSRWWAGGFGLLDTASDELAAYALERGARLDVHSAARLGHVQELRGMIARSPGFVNARGGDGKTPLHWARTVEIAQLLLDAGADVDLRDIDHESTPAQHLIGERPEVVRYLVSRGCATDIFIAAALGDTSLALRHLDANPDCIRMRVNSQYFPMNNPHAGGTIYQWTLGFNVSPHEVARKFGQAETLALLLARSPLEVRLLVNCWLGEESTVDAILQQEPGLAQRLQRAEFRQLADAARNNDVNAVRLMAKAGLPVESKGQHAATALHWAAWHGNVPMAEILIASGASLEDANNEFNGTPLGWALHGSENGWHRQTGDYPGVIRALLSAGAKVPARPGGTEEARRALDSSKEPGGA